MNGAFPTRARPAAILLVLLAAPSPSFATPTTTVWAPSTPAVRRRIRLAAARRDLTIREYVRQALDRQLDSDLATALHAADDPVLADLGDNAEDGVYDRR